MPIIDSQVMFLEDGTSIRLIHYTYHNGTEWVIACSTNLRAVASTPRRPYPWKRTNDPSVVNCPSCKSTAEFIGHANLAGLPCQQQTSN